MITRDLRDFLLGDADIVSRVAARVYPNRAPAGTAGELLILTEVSAARQYSLANEVTQRQVIVQVECYSDQPHQAESLFELVRNRLSGYRGTAGTASIHGTRIISEGADTEKPADSSDIWVERYRGDFQFFHGVAVPTHT